MAHGLGVFDFVLQSSCYFFILFMQVVHIHEEKCGIVAKNARFLLILTADLSPGFSTDWLCDLRQVASPH